MRAFSIEYSSEAMNDLRAIYRYIAFELLAPQAAKGQTDRIQDAIDGLDRFPEEHQLVPWEPWYSMGLRQMPVNHYIVYYLTEPESEKVFIVRILYGGRDVKKALMDSIQNYNE